MKWIEGLNFIVITGNVRVITGNVRVHGVEPLVFKDYREIGQP